METNEFPPHFTEIWWLIHKITFFLFQSRQWLESALRDVANSTDPGKILDGLMGSLLRSVLLNVYVSLWSYTPRMYSNINFPVHCKSINSIVISVIFIIPGMQQRLNSRKVISRKWASLNIISPTVMLIKQSIRSDVHYGVIVPLVHEFICWGS